MRRPNEQMKIDLATTDSVFVTLTKNPGDFDGSANALWTLWKESQELRVPYSSVKENMDGVRIFVRSCLLSSLLPHAWSC